MVEKKPHHHGNLREALIDAGIALLHEGGIEALTLRQCSIRAGVSHAAPAHHFSGLVSLKAAIVARGYHIFAETMLAEKVNATPTPHSQLLAICHGYLKFADQNRALFTLMFSPHSTIDPVIDPVTLEEVVRESSAGYQVLRDACAPFEHGNAGEPGTETMVWSLVHGYATLFADEKTVGDRNDLVPSFDQIFAQLRLRTQE